VKDKCTEEIFLRDVKDHVLTVIRDDGLSRHLQFKDPKSTDMFFDIITWRGELCFTGDMGTFTFRRTDDMLRFFRSSTELTGPLYINKNYWAEKCTAADKCDGLEQYSEDKAREVIDDWVRNQIEDYGGGYERDTEEGPEFAKALRNAVQSDIYDVAEIEFEFSLRRTVEDFSFEWEGHTYRITDFWESYLTEYSYRFVWCCYAMAWGIRAYDKAKGEGKE
jgi:hypothetical protein